jgi:isopenicillin N synthase-like dioxygenase
LGPKENYNKVSFANIYIESSFSIILNDSRFMNVYKNKTLEQKMHKLDLAPKSRYSINFFLLRVKETNITSGTLELASKTTKNC